MTINLRNVTIRQLRALAALAEGGSVTAASGRLGLTQPAVTQQLRLLQDQTNLSLIQRTGDGMLLTDAGREVLELTKRIEAAIKACQESLDMMAGCTGGSVSIGAVSTAKYFVPYAIAAFSERHPKVGIKLTIGNREEVRHEMRGYDLDFAIMGRPPEDVDVEAHLIGNHPHVIVAARNHWLAKDSGLAVVDLSHETFLTRERGSGTRTLMEALFAAAELQPNIGMEMSSNETIKQAVIAGLGIAFISAHTVAAELEDGRMVVLDVGGLPVIRQWFVVRRRDKVLLPPARALLDFLSSEGGKFLPALPEKPRST
jgi:LysR family transcriptional regulator, low CO2-responsive transcriptional regulator